MKETEKKQHDCYKLRDEAGYPLTLDVRLKTDDRYGFPYSYLIWKHYNPSEGITLRFSSYTVFVKGRNLKELYEALLNHRVEYIQEQDNRYDTGPESDPFIYQIEVKEPDPPKPRGQ